MAYAAKLILEWQQSMNTSIGCFEQGKVNKRNKNKIVTLKNDNEKNKHLHVEKKKREKKKKSARYDTNILTTENHYNKMTATSHCMAVFL